MSSREKRLINRRERSRRGGLSKNGSFDGLGDAILSLFRSTPEDQSYDAGYHDARSGKEMMSPYLL